MKRDLVPSERGRFSWKITELNVNVAVEINEVYGGHVHNRVEFNLSEGGGNASRDL